MIAFLGLCLAFISILFAMYYNLMDREISRKEYIDELGARRPEKISKIYKRCLEKGLDKLDDWLDAPHSTKALIFNTFFAILYTFSFFVISWVAGQSGKIGTISILPDSLPTISWILSVLSFVLALMIIFKHKKIDSRVQSLLDKKIPPKVALWAYRLLAATLITCIVLFSGREYFLLCSIILVFYCPALTVGLTSILVSLYPIAIAVTGIGADAGAPVVGGAVGVALIVAFAVGSGFAFSTIVIFAVAITVGFTVELAGAIRGLGLVAILVAVIVERAGGKKKFLLLYSCCVFTIFMLFIGLFFEVNFLEPNFKFVSYLFFIVILPFLNGFVDYVSFCISRLLGRKILKDQTLKAFLWHFAIDFAAAVLLLGLLVFGICFGVELFNTLVVKKPDLMIDLPLLIAGAKKAPFGPEGLWITLMLFSTLVPTFAHFVIAFIGVYTIYLTPRILRQKIADVLEENRSKRSQILPIFYFSMRPLLSILFAIGFWWIVGYAVNKYIIHYADLLSKVAYWGIELADAALIK